MTPIDLDDPRLTPWTVFAIVLDDQDGNAVRLHQYLHVQHRQQFFTKEDLLPGSEWDVEIPRVLKHASAVVVIVNVRREEFEREAWYGREEVALTIEQQRSGSKRVVVVTMPGFEKEVPYGLRRICPNPIHLSALEGSYDAALREIRRQLVMT